MLHLTIFLFYSGHSNFFVFFFVIVLSFRPATVCDFLVSSPAANLFTRTVCIVLAAGKTDKYTPVYLKVFSLEVLSTVNS